MGKPKAPKPPDPRETSAASTSTNVGTAISNAFLNNYNQVTPDGSLSFDQTGSYQWNDPYTGQTYEIPRFTATQTLSPQQQAVKEQSDAAQLNLAGLANDQSGFLKDYMSTPFDYSPGEHENWAMGLYDQLSGDKIQRDEEALRSRLAAQGIKAGSDAYANELSSFGEAAGNARNQYLLDSYRTGFSTAQAERNQPINEITALLSGSQVSNPNFVGTPQQQIPTTDVAGLINENYNQKMGQYQQKMASRQNLMGGLFGLGANLIAASDERVKKNVDKVGELKGHGLYEFNYKGEPKGAPKHTGVMAQQVERKRKDAVMNIGGIKHVDYGALFGAG